MCSSTKIVVCFEEITLLLALLLLGSFATYCLHESFCYTAMYSQPIYRPADCTPQIVYIGDYLHALRRHVVN